ncbi:hypothetical protein HJC23_002069 [Cyclotella cryptica]|uniref:Uncharacterized protein n=1 Tax=Cyclotella cryptica TaxID=29204 RepID=A0ABD3Q6J0_9STRA|eukprot:CCRYP_008309-RA/>CCRYP_008309-RA protein AED:0.31 eAED:0.31 QI:0/-1/0/1/-1/1/1/0/637
MSSQRNFFSRLSLLIVFLPTYEAADSYTPKVASGRIFGRRVNSHKPDSFARNPNSCFAVLHTSCRRTLQFTRVSFAPDWRLTTPRHPLEIRFTIGDTKSSDLPNPLPPQRNSQRVLLFLAVYVLLPFLTCTFLNVTNDSYQMAKQQFNSAWASSGFDPQIAIPGSAEYIALSNLYNESMQSLFQLLISKRLALYFIATVATVYSGWKSYEGICAIENGIMGGPGEALDRLNREILKGEQFGFVDAVTVDDDIQSLREEKERETKEENLFSTLIDQSPQSSNIGKSIAILLPLALTASLIISYEMVVAGNVNNAATNAAGATAWKEVKGWISPYLPYLTTLPSLALCLLFTSAEFRSVFPTKDLLLKSNSIASKEPLLCTGNILALIYVMGAYFAKSHPTFTLTGSLATPIYLDLWPLQNGVNVALATTVTRALAPFLVSTSSNSTKSLRTIALALIGVTLFDAISVFGTVVNAAMDTTPTESSVMEVVARSKLAAPSQSSPLVSPWQPGLLEIIIGHDNAAITDALGLGDVVFPACLVAWALNADTCRPASVGDMTKSDEVNDNSRDSSWKYQYTSAAIVGYLSGSFFTEIVGSFSLLGKGAGLPALVFLVPTMLVFVTLVSWRRGELEEVWGIDNI